MRSAVPTPLLSEPEAGSVLPSVEGLGTPLGTPPKKSPLQAYSDRRERRRPSSENVCLGPCSEAKRGSLPASPSVHKRLCLVLSLELSSPSPSPRKIRGYKETGGRHTPIPPRYKGNGARYTRNQARYNQNRPRYKTIGTIKFRQFFDKIYINSDS